MAPWRGSITFATYTISLHYSQPAWLTCQYSPTKRSLQHNLLIILTSLHRSPFFAQPAIYVFTQNMLHKLYPVNWSAAAQNDAGAASRAHIHTPTSSSINSKLTVHMCPSVLEAPCSHPESCTRCTYVGKKCDIPSTPLPW